MYEYIWDYLWLCMVIWLWLIDIDSTRISFQTIDIDYIWSSFQTLMVQYWDYTYI
jgi:hypothetical protein